LTYLLNQRIPLLSAWGLSGIYAVSLLAAENRPFVILEARNRVGGRIFSPECHGFFSDLGPSWYWPEIHSKMARLIQAMGLRGAASPETNGMDR